MSVTFPSPPKKSRPAWQLQVIAPLDLRDTLAEFILRHSSAFGLRTSEVSRLKLSPQFPAGPNPLRQHPPQNRPYRRGTRQAQPGIRRLSPLRRATPSPPRHRLSSRTPGNLARN
ncbi:MAG: LarC family nickel insertion protein [Blastochloris sp.]|nr:LarC family nickel insertion protein [Blastochloris sp.]